MKRKFSPSPINPNSPVVNPKEEQFVLERIPPLAENKQRNLLGEEFEINKNSLQSVGKGSQSTAFVSGDHIYKTISIEGLNIFQNLNQNRYKNTICEIMRKISELSEDWPNLNRVDECKLVEYEGKEYVIIKENYIRDSFMLWDQFPELNKKQILEILLQIILTINFLYQNKIYHNDLNYNNILLIDNHKTQYSIYSNNNFVPEYIVKIIDYGLISYNNPLTRLFGYQNKENYPPFCDICYIFALFYRHGLKHKPIEKEELENILKNIFNVSCGNFTNMSNAKNTRELVGLFNKNCNIQNQANFNEIINGIIIKLMDVIA